MRWFWLTLLLLVISAFIFFPTFLSTETGKGLLTAWVNSGIRGSVAIEQLELSWKGPQKAHHIQLFDPQRKEIAQVKSLETDTSLFTLLFHRGTFGATTLTHPTLTLERDSEGVSSLEKSLSKKQTNHAKWPTLTGKLRVIDGQISIKAPKIAAIEITDFNLDYFPDKKLFHVHAFTHEGSVTGEILASGSLGEKGHILTQIENFPVAILDQIQNTQLYTQAIGDQINIKIESEGIKVIADVQSKLFNGKIDGEVQEGFFIFDPKSFLTLEVTPTFFHELISPDLRKEWTLASKTMLTFDIREGEVPLSLDWSKSRVHATARLGRAELHHAKLGHYSLNDVEGAFVSKDGISLKITGEVVGKEQAKFVADLEINDGVTFGVCSEGFPFSLLELAFEEAKALAQFFGDTVELKVNGEYTKSEGLSSTIDLNSFSTSVHGEVKGQKLKDLSFSIAGTKRFSGSWKEMLGESTAFSFSGDAALIGRILSVSNFEGKIDNDIVTTAVKGSLGKKGAPFAFDHVKIKGEGELLHLPPSKDFVHAKLNKGEFSFDIDGAKNILTAKTLTSFSVTNGGERVDSKEVKAELKVMDFIKENRLDYKAATIHFDGNLEHFPTSFFSSWFPEHASLPDLIGPTVNLKIKANYTPERVLLDLDAQSPGFSTQLAVDIGPNLHITQNRPGHLHWEMSPGRYRALVSLLSQEDVPYELRSSPALDIEIEKISCPEKYPDSVKTFLCRSGVSGKIKIGPMLFVNPETKDKFTLNNITGGILGENFSRKMHIDLDGDALAPNLAKKDNPHFSIDLDILNAWNEGKIALSGEVDLHHLPVKQLLGIMPLNSIFRTKTVAVLGELINANISAQIAEMQGPINLDISASNFKGVFPFQLVNDHLELRDYLIAEITLTDAVSQNFLLDINPMLIKGARSDHPLKLYIAPEGFSLPIPWSFQALNIEHAIVDIGKIYVHNGGAIQELMKFLKSKPPKDKMMRAWFTPVFLSLKNGTLKHDRFDMLLHKKVHIALWGRVDLIKSKVWMTLGIAPSTLKQRFNVLGLTKKDMFQVKMRGKTSDVELDWSSAYTRIGILIARLAGGPPGYLVGGILEQVIGALGEEPTPPQTTYPFPWDEKKSQESDAIPQITHPPSSSGKKGRKKLLEFLIP